MCVCGEILKCIYISAEKKKSKFDMSNNSPIDDFYLEKNSIHMKSMVNNYE
mgnify:CR=1 FL=1